MTKRYFYQALYLNLIIATIFIVGCSGSSGINQWIEQHSIPSSKKKGTIVESSHFEPLVYVTDRYPSPFAEEKLGSIVSKDISATVNKTDDKFLIEARQESERPKQPLEAYEISQLKLVGHIQNSKENTALIEANGIIHQVSVGNYLGTSLGKITAISETEVKIRELFQSSGGQWQPREVSLTLNSQSL